MSAVHTEFIFEELSKAFAIDESKLHMIVAQLVEQTQEMKLNKLTIQPIFKQIRKSCPKSNLPEMNTLFKCCYVLILSCRESYLLLPDADQLCGDYPEFVGLPAEELSKLLKFRNAMKISLQLIDAKHHKGELLEICGRLSGKLVTTGGSQTTETKRRVLIYEREGGLEGDTKKKRKNFESGVAVKEEVSAKRIKCEGMQPVALMDCVQVKSELNDEIGPVRIFLASQLSNKFSAADALNYQTIIEKTLVQTTLGRDVNKLTLRPILKELRKLFPRKEIWNEMNVLFKCSYVLILSRRDTSMMWLDNEQLLTAYPYPEFSNLTSEEIAKLLAFRNAMKISLQLIDAKHHKGELLEICGRLTGRAVTTGGGQTADTTRCVMIYEQEGGIAGCARAVRPANPVKQEDSFIKCEPSTFDILQDACGLDSMRYSDNWFSQPAAVGLERTDTMGSFGLFDRSLSTQSYGNLALFGSIGNLAADMPLDIPVSSEATSAEVRSASQKNTKVAPASAVVTQPAAAVAVGGSGTPEIPTDIDTELDSVEVATEVDENEVVEEVEVEGAGDEGNDGPVSEHDAAELHELLRTQSAAPQECDFLTRSYTTDLRGRLLVPSQSIYRSESILSVDMGIARLGSLRSLNPEAFNWSQ